MSDLAESHGALDPPREIMPKRAGSAWLDPVRWSWLVRSYGLFLIVTTLVEYLAVVGEIMAPWLPADRLDEPRGLVLLVWLVLPFVFSQALGILWMVLVARVRTPDEGPALSLAREAVALAAAHRGRWRTPRLLAGDIADPCLISVLGFPFLIIPRRGLQGFYHYDDRPFARRRHQGLLARSTAARTARKPSGSETTWRRTWATSSAAAAG